MTTRQGDHPHRLTINGARLHVRDRGAGPAIVFIHGGLGAASEWDALAAELTARHRVITFDCRGHGQSDNPAGVLSYPQLADDTAALISVLGLVAPTVVGWSDGGQVALELSVRHRDAVGALVVGGAYPEFDDSGLRVVHQRLIDELREELRGQPGPQLAALMALHPNWPELLDMTATMWSTYPGLSVSTVAATAIPVLVLAADHDDLVSLHLHLQLFAQLHDAELAVIPGAHHETPFDADRAPLLSTLVHVFTQRRHARSSTPGRN